MMRVGLVAKRSVAGVAPAPNRPPMPVNRLRGCIASAFGFRALLLIVSLALLSAVIGLFPGRALGTTSCVLVKILLGGPSGNDITGMTESRYVGQQTVLYASYTLPSGVYVNTQSWSVGGTTVGGWTTVASLSSPAGYTGTNFNGESTTFYWTAPDNAQNVTFTLKLSDGGTATAGATFNVAGPTSVSLSPNPPAMGDWQISSAPNLQLGNTNSASSYGITFNGNATSPSGDTGTYEWVQLLSTYEWDRTSGSTTSKCTGLHVPGLDSIFPYATGLKDVSDSPYVPLESPYSRETLSFAATMYMMWNPGTSSNDIPVPLGYVTWQALGDATSSNNNWTVQTDSSKSAGSFQASASTSGLSWKGVFNGTVQCQ